MNMSVAICMSFFQISRNGTAQFYVDGYHIASSNWARWVNCARNIKEENILMFTCRGKEYYVTMTDVYPGQELLSFYGDAYVKLLKIDINDYYNG